jgi:hypothetical protein
LHAEEIGVEEGRESDLVHEDFCEEGEGLGCVVEVVAEEYKPVELGERVSRVQSFFSTYVYYRRSYHL